MTALAVSSYLTRKALKHLNSLLHRSIVFPVDMISFQEATFGLDYITMEKPLLGMGRSLLPPNLTYSVTIMGGFIYIKIILHKTCEYL